jgi:F-type H+-transporting ATPase subunit gamma
VAATTPTSFVGPKTGPKNWRRKGLGYRYVIVGRKANQYFKRREQPIDAAFTGLEQIPTADEASSIADELLSYVPVQ